MTLESLELVPRGDAGWGSGVLRFGRSTTLLLGPGGAGKTPIIKALAYALGHPVELPRPVREKVSAVKLVMRTSTGSCEIERQLAPNGIGAAASEADGPKTTFTDERTLSEWVLSRLGVSLRTLTTKNGGKTAPYMSVIGPMFLVDQDVGWTNLYVPFETGNFVRDQREEVIRWLLDLPAKHRPTDRNEYQAAKMALAAVQEQIAFKRRGLEALQRELGEDRAPNASLLLEERRSSLAAGLARAYSVLGGVSHAESAFDIRVRDALQRRDQVNLALANAKRRKGQLLDVRAEVNAELGALEENELAADAFRAFCGNKTCQFFRTPDESYGRRVLYLKDQLKDFESSDGETERELLVLQEQLTAAEAALKSAINERQNSTDHGDAAASVSAVQSMAKEFADAGVRLDHLERIAREREQLDVLINRELRANEDVNELKPSSGGRKTSSRLLDARQHLTATFKEWMHALHTPNMPDDVTFDEELRLTLGGERFGAKASYSGSTRTRIVLAFHAAMVETSLIMGGVHPRLLVLDAPRQHELDASDLRSYIRRFHEMSAKQTDPVQLVLSAIDPAIVPEACMDAVWKPPFEFGDEPRFLGPS